MGAPPSKQDVISVSAASKPPAPETARERTPNCEPSGGLPAGGAHGAKDHCRVSNEVHMISGLAMKRGPSCGFLWVLAAR
jgi:hypothetical protein